MSFPPTNPGIFNASYTTYTYDRVARVDILSARGYAIICNGIDPNTKIDPDNGQTDLLMRAPSGEYYPMITFAPSSEGKIFGNDFKWRIRYSNSKTGETSGMSPIPEIGLSLGAVTTGTSFLGQIAYFKIEGTDRVGIDTIELLRNVSSGTVWFVVDKQNNPGAGSYASFTDNNPDEDVWNLEQADLRVNPSYYTPHPPPCARAYQHSTGRVWLYGRQQAGRHATGSATMAADSHTVNATNGFWTRTREGERLTFTVDPDRTVYRIVEVTDPNAMEVTPKAPALVASGSYEIIDDTDIRNIYLMQPLSPCQHDPLDVITVGQDRSDGVKAVFAIGGTTFSLTRRRLYRFDDDISEDPAASVRITQIADVGCAGFWAWCMVPNGGVVFISEKHGVMLFDGSVVTPLGSGSPWLDFRPKAQFQDADEGALVDAEVAWDPDNKQIVVAYCPTGVMFQYYHLVYDPATGAWRGPWRRPTTKMGMLRAPSGEDSFFLGDQNGTLGLEGDSVADLVGAVVSGVVSTVTNNILLTATASVFTAAMAGAPIVLDDTAGNRYWNFVARYISGTQVVLGLQPSTAPASPWTFKVGAIDWKATTGYLDLGEPGQPKRLSHLAGRYERMVTSVDSLRVQAASEGEAFEESADAVSMTETTGLVKFDANLNCGGNTTQLRLSGTASNGGPKVTQLLAHMTVHAGTDPGKDGDQKKRIVTPTAST